MTLDLTQFVKSRNALVPIYRNQLQYERKKYSTNRDVEDGWYRVELEGNDANIIEQVFVNEDDFEKKKLVYGYTHANNIIFQNFDVARRKFAVDVSAPLRFGGAMETFSAVRAIRWEDKNFYAVSLNYSDLKIMELKVAYEDEANIDEMKGLTPELRCVYLFHDLQRHAVREAQRQADEQERLERERATAEERERVERANRANDENRLTVMFRRAGGTVTSFRRLNASSAEIHWTLDATGTEFNSVIDLATGRVIEAGFCLSGHDREHNVTSIVMLADDYEERGVTYHMR